MMMEFWNILLSLKNLEILGINTNTIQQDPISKGFI